MPILAIAAPDRARRSILRLLLAFIRRKGKHLPAGLSYAQIKDAGIAWELAGYGRGADVSMLAITILNSQR